MIGVGVGPGFLLSGFFGGGGGPVSYAYQGYWPPEFLQPIPENAVLSPFQVTGDSSPGFYVSATSDLAGGLAEAWRVTTDVNYRIEARNTDAVEDVFVPGSFNDRDSGITLIKTINFPNDFILADVDGLPDTPNNPALVVNFDTGEATGLNATCRPTAGGSVWAYIASILGTEIVSTHGGSYTAGGDVTAQELLVDGYIPHRVAVNVHGLKYLSNNGTGFVHPARAADAGYADPMAFDYYGGNDERLKMGSHFAIPADVTAASIGITTAAGEVFFNAFQEFGVHAVDNTAWDSVAINATEDCKATIETWATRQDLIRCFAALRVVTYLPLDHVQGAAAAFSTRKLRAAYTGSALRVRRSSDNAEADIGFTGNDLDTTALLAHCGAGSGFVVTWYDQSGNGRDATQPTTANQPRIVNAGVVELSSGKPSLLFDGTNDDLALNAGGNAMSNSVPGITGLTVMNSATTDSTRYAWIISTGLSTSNARLGLVKATGGNIQGAGRVLDADGGAFPTSAGAFNSPTIATALLNATSPLARIYGNGTQLNTVTSGLATSQSATSATNSLNVRIGSRNSGYHTGCISELIFYMSALSDANRLLVERNQGAYYGITVA